MGRHVDHWRGIAGFRVTKVACTDGTTDVLSKGSDLFDEKGNFLPDEKVAIDVLQEFAEMSQAQIAVMPDRIHSDPAFFRGPRDGRSSLRCFVRIGMIGFLQQFAP